MSSESDGSGGFRRAGNSAHEFRTCRSWQGAACFRENSLLLLKGNADRALAPPFRDRKRLQENAENSLMLVTVLNQYIGYDKAAKLAKTAHQKVISLRVANRELGFLTEEEFDSYLRPEKMIAPA